MHCWTVERCHAARVIIHVGKMVVSSELEPVVKKFLQKHHAWHGSDPVLPYLPIFGSPKSTLQGEEANTTTPTGPVA